MLLEARVPATLWRKELQEMWLEGAQVRLLGYWSLNQEITIITLICENSLSSTKIYDIWFFLIDIMYVLQ